MHLLDQLTSLFAENGYAAVLIALLLSGVGLPLPEDIILVAGGIIAGLGYANVHVMFGVGMAGALAGDSAMFMLGHHFGGHILKWRLFAWLLPPKRYAKVQQKFERYGNRVIFLARFLPGLRAATFITAGATHRVSYWRFLLLDGLAAFISVPIWVYLGYLGAYNHEWLVTWMHRGRNGLLVLVTVLVVGALIWWLARRRSRAARRAQQDR